MSKNSARLGTLAATWACPPSRSWRSNRTTEWPRSAAVTAAWRPPGPPPTTTTRRRRRGRGTIDDLASGAGVLDAAQPPVEAHPSHALLVARQAGADVGGVAGPGLGAEVGVGDLPAHHAHQVAHPVGQGPVGLQRVLEPPDPDHRQVDGGPDGARDEQGVAGRDLHAGLDHVQGGRGHPDRGVDVVDLPGGLDHPGHRDGVLDPGAALDQLVPAEAHAEGPVGADGGPDGVHDLEQEAGPVGQGPAVAVGPSCWWPGRGSRARSTSASTAARSRRIRRPCSGRPRWRSRRRSRRSRGARPPSGTSRNSGSGTGLGAHTGRREYIEEAWPPLWLIWAKIGHVVGVHGVGDPSVAVDHLGVEPVDELLVGPVGRVGRVLLGDDEAGPAGRPGRVVGGVLLGGQPVGGVVGQVGREHDAVGHGDRTEPERGEQVPVAAAGTHRGSEVAVAHRADAPASTVMVRPVT